MTDVELATLASAAMSGDIDARRKYAVALTDAQTRLHAAIAKPIPVAPHPYAPPDPYANANKTAQPEPDWDPNYNPSTSFAPPRSYDIALAIQKVQDQMKKETK
jgi:hypothetical protein